MAYLIWKVKVGSGEPVRALPVLFLTYGQASTEATVLNDRTNANLTGCTYIVREAAFQDICGVKPT